MKGIIGVIIGALVVVLIIMGVMSFQNASTSQGEPSEGEGRVYFSITDDTADIQSVNEIEMEIEEIEVRNQAQSWTTISSNSKTYPLLALKANGKIELYNANNIDVGVYDQVRITLGDVVVDSETEGRVDATLPSEEITFDVNVVVNDGADTHVTLDFIADQSLHTTTEGEFLFAPVVEVESRSNTQVEVGSDNAVTVSGGAVDSQVSVGVDIDGSTKPNFRLDTSTGLEIENSALGETTFMLDGQSHTKGEAGSNNGNENGGNGGASVDVDSSNQGGVNVGENGADTSVDSETDVNINN